MSRIYFNRTGGVHPKIEGEIKAVYAQVEGWSNDRANDRLGVDFTVDPPASVLAQIQAVVTAHVDTTAQDEAAREADYAALLAMADAGIAQIANDLSDLQAGVAAVNADKVTLTGTPTQAQVLGVVRRVLDRELVLYADLDHVLNRQDKVIRVLRHVAKGG